MKLQLVATVVVCLAFAEGAVAEQTQPEQLWNRHRGFYVEGNVGTGFGWFLFSLDEDKWFGGSGFGGYSWLGTLGYSLTTHHAIEGGYGQWYTPDEDQHGDRGQIDFGYLAWRGTVPLGDRFAFFGKLGPMVAAAPHAHGQHSDLRQPHWLLFTGLGVSYAVTPQIDLSLQYQGACYILVSGGILTLGAGYHF
jgi:opacity protein-like surface antigen